MSKARISVNLCLIQTKTRVYSKDGLEKPPNASTITIMTDEATTETSTNSPKHQFSTEFLAMLRCPESKAPLVLRGERLLCKESKKAYRITNGIPNLIIEEAEPLSDEEIASL